MARIRTIKPEFFTSEDIVNLSMAARLLYIALWCEADREGRLNWKPLTFKMRYFPGDSVDIRALSGELIDAGLVRLYGDGHAHIPTFLEHQHVNPREAQSTLPDPRVTHASSRVSDASARVQAPSVTRREEGKEGKGKEQDQNQKICAASASPAKGKALSPSWQPTPDQIRWATETRPDVNVTLEADKFRDFWISKTGQGATKKDWEATWRNWIRNARGTNGAGAGSIGSHHPQLPYVPQSKIDRENAENEMRPSLLPMPSILTDEEQARYEASRAEALRKRAAGERVPGLDDVRDQLRLIGGE